MKRQKDLKSLKKGVTWIEIKGKLMQNALNLLNNKLW